MQWGQVDEYVYEKDSSGDYAKESELNWQIKNMFQVGLNVDGGYKKLKGKIHFSALIPDDSGIMEDSDWWDLTDMKTTYSKSENTITQALDFSALLKYEFQPLYCLKIAPTLAFEYKTISFEARNGYGWYGHEASPHVSWDDPAAHYHASLFGIDYKRDVMQIFIGYYFEFSPIKKIRMFESCSIAPYAYTASYDTHYANAQSTMGVDYVDEVCFFFTRVKYSTGVYYILNERLECGLNMSFFYAFATLGTNYQKNHSEKTYTNMTEDKNVKGGAGAWCFDIGFSLKYIFL